MELTQYQREMIKARFVTEVSELEFDYARSVILFIGLTNLITVSGILITSFTTLTKAITVDAYWQNVLSWLIWTLSLALTLANGWMTTFGIYKKYVINDVTLEKMYNEGWSFIAGVNRYEKLSTDESVSTFCSKIEQIITRTTIKLMSGNTAGVNVHEILEVQADEKVSVGDTIVGTVIGSNGVPTPAETATTSNERDVIVEINTPADRNIPLTDNIHLTDNIQLTDVVIQHKRKKKTRRSKSNSNPQ